MLVRCLKIMAMIGTENVSQVWVKLSGLDSSGASASCKTVSAQLKTVSSFCADIFTLTEELHFCGSKLSSSTFVDNIAV